MDEEISKERSNKIKSFLQDGIVLSEDGDLPDQACRLWMESEDATWNSFKLVSQPCEPPTLEHFVRVRAARL